MDVSAEHLVEQARDAGAMSYIVKPFHGGGLASLFSTHPPIEERVRRLRAIGI